MLQQGRRACLQAHIGDIQPKLQRMSRGQATRRLLNLSMYTPHRAASVQPSRCLGPQPCSPTPALSSPSRNLQPRISRHRSAASAGTLTAPQDIQPHHHTAWPQHSTATTTQPQAVQLGKIELIMGPMFAGKTTRLIHHARMAQAAGRQVLILKSAKDKRYSEDSLASHDGDQLPCMAVHALADLLPSDLVQADVIAIDEAQFFPDLLDFVKIAADKHQKHVLVAGLDGDFKRQRFGQILDLVPLADQVHKLHARCFVEHCAHPAIFSMRITRQQEQEVVGGADIYAAACRTHYRLID